MAHYPAVEPAFRPASLEKTHMYASIALLRGINVAGKNRLPMKELVQQLEKLELLDVQTYIQSGNVVFSTKRKPAAKLSSQISQAIKASHGFEPPVLVMGEEVFRRIVQQNPFPKKISEPKTLHVFFLAKEAKKADMDAIENAKVATECFELTADAFYLHAPDGFGRSKLASNVEKYLGVPATARNWNTIQKLREMLDQLT